VRKPQYNRLFAILNLSLREIMQKNLSSLALIVVIFCLWSLSIGCNSATTPGSSTPPTTSASTKPLPPGEPTSGKIAPNFTLPNLEDRPVNLTDYRGKIVVLNFWATWCGPCVREMPHFVTAQDTYRNKGVEFIGISLDDEGKSVVAPFVKEHNINYNIVLGDSKTGDLYGGITAIPSTFFIDRQGSIYRQEVGAISAAELTQVLEEMVSK
jgi:peroxiredoxin